MNLTTKFKSIAKPAAVASALMMALTPTFSLADDAADDPGVENTGNTVTSTTNTATRAPTATQQAYNHSQELGVAGILIVRAPIDLGGEPEMAWGELVAITRMLLKESAVENYKLVAVQASAGQTNFSIFIDGIAREYTWGDIENGIQDINSRVERSIMAAEHDALILAGT
ncbi:MAG: hypothetical protein JKY34_02485 [Kordiimonadaceae bacterium]|nr:hypothetical protein [Kordiimonadaceae bacterium]